ncbi:MAG: hypothetical protein OXB88_05080 [Bacteriovoracales bacterium]|nr:hypothetical protein [Bacteriovoracales bacterium]
MTKGLTTAKIFFFFFAIHLAAYGDDGKSFFKNIYVKFGVGAYSSKVNKSQYQTSPSGLLKELSSSARYGQLGFYDSKRESFGLGLILSNSTFKSHFTNEGLGISNTPLEIEGSLKGVELLANPAMGFTMLRPFLQYDKAWNDVEIKILGTTNKSDSKTNISRIGLQYDLTPSRVNSFLRVYQVSTDISGQENSPDQYGLEFRHKMSNNENHWWQLSFLKTKEKDSFKVAGAIKMYGVSFSLGHEREEILSATDQKDSLEKMELTISWDIGGFAFQGLSDQFSKYRERKKRRWGL